MPRTSWCWPLNGCQTVQFLLFAIIVVFNADFAISIAPKTAVPTVCPLNLTQQLPCFCDVLSDKSGVQILCNNVQPDRVFGVLGGYSVHIDKLAIRNCPEKTNTLEPLLPLKIRSLEIAGCSIAKVQANAFDALADTLEELWLYRNELTSIPQLAKLRRLQGLNLNNNLIKDVFEPAFAGLRQLKFLRLRKNRICALLPNSLNDQRGSLELLDLSHNCFSHVPAASLRSFMELKYLNLAGNNIEGILPMQFMTLPNLLELRLHANKLKKIALNGFLNVPALKLLFLENNQLASLDQGTLQAFKDLKLVDLGHNDFYKTPSFKDMAELEEVRLHDNLIHSIDTLTFSSNPKLKRINLQNNQIETIARNSFDALEQLEVLILSNNSLTTIDKGTLEGMRKLKDLVLRNNSIAELSRDSFASVPELTLLDLSENELKTLRAGTFAPLQHLHTISLSNNEIETMEAGAFETKVDNVLLDGNQLRCDEQLDWFVTWLVKNKVRTFLPSQPEIKCASPEEKKGTRLKDLMIQKNNVTEALANSFQAMNGGQGADLSNPNDLFNKLLPNIARQAESAKMGNQVMGQLGQTFPELSQLPGMKFLPAAMQSPPPGGSNRKSLDGAIDLFSEPLVKFASGATPTGADVNQLLSSLPNLLVNIPGFGNVDVSKMNPALIEHVLKGGQIPGVPRETLDDIVKQYMQRLYVSAAQAQGITTTEFPPLPPGTDASKFLRPMTELPQGLTQNVVDGKPLPHLTADQTNVIKAYYMQHMPVGTLMLGTNNDSSPANVTELLPKKVFQMMKLLPPNYNLSKLPPEVVKQVMRGDMPNMDDLPTDLQQWIKDNIDRLLASVEKTSDMSIEKIMKKLPHFEQPKMETFSPYDINEVDAELVSKRQQSEESARLWRIFAASALGLAGALTLGVLSAFCWYLRRSGRTAEAMASDGGGGQVLPSVVREQSFRPVACSTLKSSSMAQ